MTQEEMWPQAAVPLGGIADVKQDRNKSGSVRAAETLSQDIRHGIRALSKAPVFTAAAIMALALGIGAGTAIFSVVNAVLLRPLPYPDSDRIVVFATSSPAGPRVAAASPVEFNFWREQAITFQDICAYRFGRISMTDVDRPEQIRSAFVTSGYFRLFGEKAAFGRTFTAEEDRPDGGNVVVLSAEFQRRAFGGDFRMIGKEIFLGGKPYQVVGIMAPALELPAAFNPGDARDPIDVWMPFQIDDHSTDANNYFTAAARLKPGISLRGIQAHLQLATSQFRRRFPAAGLRPRRASRIDPVEALRHE
ncbi:MAG TPA: ABC transporter permease [Candidatus Acidoferrales bacterium]|jgi:putative ABC transport system permease protein|nr:ABC transporter permease [Candidatus Acidoferrales bacterium]